MELIETDILADQDISSPLLVSTYTADKDRLILVQLYLKDIIGNGVYKVCFTKQDEGTGDVYQSPTFYYSVEFGTDNIYLLTDEIPIESQDIIKIYVEGTVLDTSVDILTRIFSVSKKRQK